MGCRGQKALCTLSRLSWLTRRARYMRSHPSAPAALGPDAPLHTQHRKIKKAFSRVPRRPRNTQSEWLVEVIYYIALYNKVICFLLPCFLRAAGSSASPASPCGSNPRVRKNQLPRHFCLDLAIAVT